MPAAEREVQQAWDQLFDGIRRIFFDDHMGRNDYMKLYSSTFVVCSNTTSSLPDSPYVQRLDGSDLWNSVINGTLHPDSTLTPQQHLQAIQLAAQSRRNTLLTVAVYESIRMFLVDYVSASIVPRLTAWRDDYELLDSYVDMWMKYEFSASVLSGVCNYVDRHWSGRFKASAQIRIDGLSSIYGLAMEAWWNELGNRLQYRLTSVCLELIDSIRCCHNAEGFKVRQIADSLVKMGHIAADQSNIDDYRFYKLHFEQALIQSTEHYYALECVDILNTNKPMNLINKVIERTHQEKALICDYLVPCSLEPVIAMIEKVLVLDHIDMIFSELSNLFDRCATQEIESIYNLLLKYPDILSTLKTLFEDHIFNVGLKMVLSMPDDDEENPYRLLHAIIELHKSYSSILEISFKRSPQFGASLDKAFGRFVNYSDPATGIKENRIAEMLARYSDHLIRKTLTASLSEVRAMGPFDNLSAAIMTVFSYLENKDVFQKFYSRLLAKRLINQTCPADENEMQMINKLKQSSGYEYTAKLQRMFQDVANSHSCMERFKKAQSSEFLNKSMQFNALVLSAGTWPFSASTSQPALTVPECVRSSVQNWFNLFEQFYNTEHNGRKLTWLINQTRVDVGSHCFKRKYVFQSSIPQARILLMFNDQDTLTVNEIILAMPDVDITLIKAIIPILIKSRLLKVCNCSSSTGLQTLPSSAIGSSSTVATTAVEQIDDSCVLRLSEDYRNRRMRINLNVPIRSEQCQESDLTLKHVEEDRSMLIQATIVRIMKSRKEIDNNQLIAETISQLSSRFKPRVQSIKKCIDILIEKEYLQRDHTQREVFRYLA